MTIHVLFGTMNLSFEKQDLMELLKVIGIQNDYFIEGATNHELNMHLFKFMIQHNLVQLKIKLLKSFI